LKQSEKRKKISQSKEGSITKEKFAEMLFPGIPVTGIAKSSVIGIAESTTSQPEEVAPRWVHELVDWLWDLFFDLEINIFQFFGLVSR
jgi:hypothetical protein